MDMRLVITSEGTQFEPSVEDGVELERPRDGSPGKLTFSTLKTGTLPFDEGDEVQFFWKDKLVFRGYVFKKNRNKEGRIKVTCYDQLRYLKNKYTYLFTNKTATQIVKALLKDFNLQGGRFADTKYVIPNIAEENKSAIDIILDALQETIQNTGRLYVLYDDAGKIFLGDSATMIGKQLVYDETAEDFDYTSSIDDETYNEIVLYYKEKEKPIQIFMSANKHDIEKWGTLRYFEEVKNPSIGKNKADSLLELYDRKTRELKINGAFGDLAIRGGSLIPVKLNLGDIIVNNYMLVDTVTHKFEENHHSMDLTLQGAW